MELFDKAIEQARDELQIEDKITNLVNELIQDMKKPKPENGKFVAKAEIKGNLTVLQIVKNNFFKLYDDRFRERGWELFSEYSYDTKSRDANLLKIELYYSL